jgi:succinoglycan biosynthesis transport protein ExoP
VVLYRRRYVVLAVLAAVTGFATVRSLLMKPAYRASARIIIERENPNILDFKGVANEDTTRDDYYQTQYRLLQSRALARRVIEDLDLLNDPEYGGPRTAVEMEAAEASPPGSSPVMEGAIDAVLARVTVTPIRNSRLVTLAYESGRAESAALVANRMAQLFVRRTLDLRSQTSSEANEWLGGQVEEQRRRIAQAETELQRLKQEQGLVNIDERRILVGQQLKELGTTLTGLRTARLEKQALYNQMHGSPNPEELPEVMRSPLVQSLRIELAGLEGQIALLLEKYMEPHPEVLKIRSQIQDTRRKLQAEAQRVIRAAENDYRAAAAQEASVAGALEAAKAEITGLSRRGTQYDEKRRDLEAAQRVLNDVVSRSKQTGITSELRVSNISIVDPAVVPGAPVRPNTRRDITLGLLVGLGLGMLLAQFLEHFDNTVREPGDVRRQLGIPLLGVVPEAPEQGSALLARSGTGGPFGEGYRVLRTALGSCWPTKASRILVVTSTIPSEGKTLTSVNLALALAAANQTVLLVDGDLRKPHAHAVLRRPRLPGLVDILFGQNLPSESIQPRASSSMSFLPAGTPAPSPGDLLTTDTLKGLLGSLRTCFDWVIVDSPPIGAVPDALLLAPLADGVIIVVGADMTSRDAARHTIERVRETGARVLGVVLNRARLHRNPFEHDEHYGRHYGKYGEKASARGRVASIAEGRAQRYRARRA